MKFSLLTIFIILFFSCQSARRAHLDIEIPSSWIRAEPYEQSQIRSFLHASIENRALCDSFLNDSSPYSFLAFIGFNSLFCKFNNGTVVVQKDSSRIEISDTLSAKTLEPYAGLDTTYKVIRPEDFIVTCGQPDLLMFWLKKNGEQKFAYYNLKSAIHFLNENDKSKMMPLYSYIVSLNELE